VALAAVLVVGAALVFLPMFRPQQAPAKVG
jgi:hypothetical protein